MYDSVKGKNPVVRRTQCCGLASAVEAQPTPWLILSIAAGAAAAAPAFAANRKRRKRNRRRRPAAAAPPRRLERVGLLAELAHGVGARPARVCGTKLVNARVDIDNDRVLDVDEIIEPVAELYSPVGLGCPCRAGIAGRDHPRRLAFARPLTWLAGRRALWKPRCLVVAG